MQLPPSFNIFLSVGKVARIRESSVMAKVFLSKGTLKSTRTKARLPAKFDAVYCFHGRKGKKKHRACQLSKYPGCFLYLCAESGYLHIMKQHYILFVLMSVLLFRLWQEAGRKTL
jgi:hypothetical protein